MDLIEPKEVTITTQAGVEKTYVFSKIPYLSVREIMAQYPSSAMPKIGDYSLNEAMAKKLLSYVAIMTENGPLRLTTAALIDNHIPDLVTGGRIELGMIEYQVGFFETGQASIFFEGLTRKALAFLTRILTQSQVQLSTQEKPASTS